MDIKQIKNNNNCDKNYIFIKWDWIKWVLLVDTKQFLVRSVLTRDYIGELKFDLNDCFTEGN